MEIVKKTDDYEIVKKRSGRYGVRNAKRQWINGTEKVEILLAEKLIKAPPPKKEEPAEASAEEAEGTEAAESADESAGEDAESAEEERSEG